MQCGTSWLAAPVNLQLTWQHRLYRTRCLMLSFHVVLWSALCNLIQEQDVNILGVNTRSNRKMPRSESSDSEYDYNRNYVRCSCSRKKRNEVIRKLEKEGAVGVKDGRYWIKITIIEDVYVIYYAGKIQEDSNSTPKKIQFSVKHEPGTLANALHVFKVRWW